MRLLIKIILLLILPAFVSAQQYIVDSLNRLISKATSDTQRINLIIRKANVMRDINLDSSIQLENKAIQDCQSLHYIHGELYAMLDLALAFSEKGDYAIAKKNLDKAGEFLKTVKDSFALLNYYNSYGAMYFLKGKLDSSLVFYIKEVSAVPSNDSSELSTIYMNIGLSYHELANFPLALTYYQKALSIDEKLNDESDEAPIYSNMAGALYSMGDVVKAEPYCLYAIKIARKIGNKSTEGYACHQLGNIYNRLYKYNEAYTYSMNGASLAKAVADQRLEASCLSDAAAALAGLNKFNEAAKLNSNAIVIADSSKDSLCISLSYSVMGDILKREGKYKEAIPFYEKYSQLIPGGNIYDPDVADHYAALSECYEKTGNFNKALSVYKLATKINDSLRNLNNIRKATELAVSYEFKKKQELAKAIQDKKDADTKRKRTQQYFIIAGLAVVVLAFIAIAVIQLRNNRQKQKANALLQHQKKEIEQQKEKVEITLTELKSTQAQLIQSEKMASLGELTAGIAHEIQNPLNFVNNFSEVNKELLEELKEEADKGNIVEVKSIANNLIDNSKKINHHGKRADAIVKGMLQHSRQTKGVKEPTPLNALCNEYLRLSYHGMLAKEKDFNAEIKTDFDESIGKINIVPQDIGRVLLNLFNNAFYAANEKSQQSTVNSPQPLLHEYKPLVFIRTKKINDKVEIRVEDNGNGIPSNIIDKIFQPFFTTKPTGEGTGLGLSL